jgi:hypothetical protein
MGEFKYKEHVAPTSGGADLQDIAQVLLRAPRYYIVT